RLWQCRSGWGFECMLFFFSSRRRHTRSKRDWSSDVCSSDLKPHILQLPAFSDYERFSGFVSIPLQGREVMLCRLIPSVEKLCKEIGRASCREREQIAEGEGAVKERRRSRRGIEKSKIGRGER